MFVGRSKELEIIKKIIENGRLMVLSGRRRVGKSQLVKEYGRNHQIVYSQAVEGSSLIQIEHIFRDIEPYLSVTTPPTSWQQLLDYFGLIENRILVIDEFPYLIKSNPSLASILQDWLDNKAPKKHKMILLGSSQSTMQSLFDISVSPLFGRADRILNLNPLSYLEFCEYTCLDAFDQHTFMKFSLVGGVPGYWRFVNNKDSPLQCSLDLYFDEFARLENEPDRLLRDEHVDNLSARAVLEAIGRGANRSSEIANRLGIKQSSLPNTISMLLKSSFITKTIPFGESQRTTKRSLYTLTDPALQFWYKVYSPHRQRWYLYDDAKRKKLITDHSSIVLEQEFRKLYPDACPYWESGSYPCEFDAVRYVDGNNPSKIMVSELKWRRISKTDKARLIGELKARVARSQLAKKYQVDSEVLGFDDIVSRLLDSIKTR